MIRVPYAFLIAIIVWESFRFFIDFQVYPQLPDRPTKTFATISMVIQVMFVTFALSKLFSI
jgi:hypothetical protein